MKSWLENIKERQREIDVFLARYPEKRQHYEKLVEQFAAAIDKDTLLNRDGTIKKQS